MQHFDRATSYTPSATTFCGPLVRESRLAHLRHVLMAGAAVTICGMSQAHAQAPSYVWNNTAGDGSLFNAQNWAPGAPPTGFSYNGALISSGNAVVGSAGGTIGSGLSVGNTTNTATLTVNNGGTLNLLASLSVGATSAVTVSGANSKIVLGEPDSHYGRININGGLTIENGGTLTAQTISTNAHAINLGSSLVTGSGSLLALTGRFGLRGDDSNIATLTLSNGGALSVSGEFGLGFMPGSGDGSGTLNIGAAAGQAAAGAGILSAASGITFGTAYDSKLVLNHTATEASPFVLSPVLTGGGFYQITSSSGNDYYTALKGNGEINQMAGVTHVTGTSLGFSGTTNVTGGKLLLATSGSALGGNFNVSGSGVLGGIGTIGTPAWEETIDVSTRHNAATQTIIGAGGTLAPGLTGTTGTLTVRGDLAFDANSIYAVKIDGNKNHDATNVSGNVTIASGAKLEVTALGGQGDYSVNYATPQQFSIITSTGTLSGTFTVQNSAFLTYTSTSDANHAYLTVALRGTPAPDRQWTGTTGTWDTAANWDQGSAPVTTGAGEAVNVAIASGEATHNGALRLGVDAGDHTTLTISGTGKLAVKSVTTPVTSAGLVTIGGTGTAAVKVSGSAASLSADSNLIVANGTLTVENGAQADGQLISVSAAPGAQANALVTGSGSSLTARNAVRIGSSTGTGTLTLTDGGTLTATTSGQNGVVVASSTTATGTLNIGAAEGQSAAGAGILNAPTFFFGSGNGTLVFNHTGTDYAFAPQIQVQPTMEGDRTIKQIAGVTRITADGSAFNGNVDVSGGSLLVDTNGKLGGAFNVTGGVLGGIGALGTAGTSINLTAGTLSPGLGNTIGTLNVAGDLAFGANSIYAVKFAGNETSDLTLVGGSVTIADGARVRATALGGQGDYGVNYAGAGYRYTILTALGAVTGQFSAVQNSAFLNYTTSSDANNVYLTVALKGDPAPTPTKYEWAGGTNDNDWSESANWTPYSPPPTYVAPINGTAVTVAINSGNAVIREAGTTLGNNLYLAENAGDQANLAITGNGTLQSSTVVVGGAGTAGLTVSGATAALNATGNILAGNGAGSNGTVTIQNGATATTTQIVGAGYSSGATGNIVVTGQNSSLTGRFLRLGYYGGTGTLTIANGATVTTTAIENGTAIAAQQGGTGTLNIGAAAGEAAVAAGTLNSDKVNFGSGTGTLVFNHTDTNYAFAPVLTSSDGSATIRHLAGTTRLTADSSAFDGTTNVSGGTLLVDTAGKLGGVFDVSGTGILGGIGTIGTAGKATTISSGTLAPGLVGAIGTLNVAGDLVFGANSTYAVNIAGNKTSDLTLVGGTTTIADGAKVLVSALGGQGDYGTDYSGSGHRYTILTSTGALTGKFTDVQDSAFLNYTSTSDANNAYLTAALKANPTNPTNPSVFTPVANTGNQIATARALDSLSQGSALWWAVANVPTYEAAREAYNQLSGAPIASSQAAMVNDSQAVRSAVNDRIRGAFDSVAAPNMAVMSYAPERDAYAYAGQFNKIAPQPAQRERESFAVWGSAFGSWGKVNSDGNAARVDTETGGLLAGVDTLVLNNWRLGLFGGYSHSKFNTSNSRGTSDSYHVGGYAGTSIGSLALRSGMSYTWYDNRSQRSITFLGQRADGHYKAGSFQAFGELGYRIDVSSAIALEPYVNASHVRLNTDAFQETGSIAALTVQEQNASTTYTTLGSRASTMFELAGFQTTARGGIGWRHAFGDIVPVSTVAFANSSSFTVSGLPIDQNVAVIEAGLDFRMLPSGTLGISYNGQYGARGSENGVNARLRVQF
ncbi:autotransporter domain-containing protein [Tardiphaga alba]|uniref:Autotransporter domain-containing protein n=1 Tax=Tardiphaga alba TaxID=340268 RepID=A0ABX8ADK3_9BRAD|nr:autotransporter domain-containing protein [Tardiphaga alba]QUS40503.1 autotransporter domain-containing protein [Tardiphaga alba]